MEATVMDFNAIVSAIGSVGFPIIACIYMVYVNNKQTEAHRLEMNNMTEAINELKIAIITLTEKFSHKE